MSHRGAGSGKCARLVLCILLNLLFFVAHGTNIFVLLLCSTAFEAAQDPHAQPPPNVGRAVRVDHMLCGVSAACSAHQPRAAADGCCHVDGTCGPVASGDPHVPPSVWRDHGDVAGHRHDSLSSHRRYSCLWDGVSCRVEGLRRIGDWTSTF
jgi:hypothetical protein